MASVEAPAASVASPTPARRGIERRSIEFIPLAERHGSVRSLFTVWFGGNMQVTAIVTGALGVILGLSLPMAIVALLVGNLIGGIVMALHSAQGPKLGIPQMIQSRAQFGMVGAAVPLVLVVLMYIGYFASSAILGGSVLTSEFGVSPDLGIIIVGALCALLAVYGYRLIHRYERWVSLICGLGFIYLTIRLVHDNNFAAAWNASGTDATVGTFILVVALAATWQITYAPYVADYSRYLPHDTTKRTAFWWTYAGSVIGTMWMMAFGCVAVALAAKAFNAGSVSFIVDQATGGTHWLFAIIIILGVIAADVLNLYGIFMSSTTTITAFWRIPIGRGARFGFVLGGGIVGVAVAIIGRTNFITNFENFILFLAYFLIPWTAVNLADFYLVRREHYSIAAIFDPRGIYGMVNWRTMIAYFIGIAVEIPFISTSFYTGPMVKHLGGADISWMIGLIVAAGLYTALMWRVGRSERATIESVEEAEALSQVVIAG